jgi:hypothetical protein
MDEFEPGPDFANNPPPLYPGAKKGRAIPGQTFEVDGVCVRRDGELFRRIGLLDKGNGCGVAAFISRWRGVTRLELHEMERMHTTFSRSGTRVFLSAERIDELIDLLQQAREFVFSLPTPKVPKKRAVAVRKQTKPKGTNSNEHV